MNLQTLKEQLPHYAKDIKLNLDMILNETDLADLTQKQIYYILLTSAYTIKQNHLISVIEETAKNFITAEEKDTAKAAAIIMAMNNIYYRFTHTVADENYTRMPPKLRMNIIANPGIDKISFELACLAASALNGCGKCMNAHTTLLEKNGVSKESIQATIRIASIINATAMAF